MAQSWPIDDAPDRFAAWTRFWAALCCAALLFAAVVAVIYMRDAAHQRALLEQESQHAVDLQYELLDSALRAVQSDLLYLSRQGPLIDFVGGEEAERATLEREYMSFACAKGVYDQIRCLDQSGHEIIRVNYRDHEAVVVPQDELQEKAGRYYFQQALELGEGEVFVSPFDLNVEHGRIERPIKPVIRFLTPVTDESGDKRALLALNYLGAQLLSRLQQVAAGFRGELMLVNTRGEYLLAPARDREWGWLLEHDRSFRNDFPEAWQAIAQSGQTEFRLRDEMFHVGRFAPGAASVVRSDLESATPDDQDDQLDNKLLLVAHVSANVAAAHSQELLRQLLAMYGAVMAVVAVLAMYWARSSELRRYHERRVVASESRLRQLSTQLLAAQESERRSLSRDLHDELGQQATAISLDLRSLAKSKGGAASSPLLKRAIDETGVLLETLHEMARKVRPRVLDELGLQDAVESLVDEFQSRSELDIDCQLRFGRDRIPRTIGENVYRILQEALKNVTKHAQVRQAEVILETDQRQIRLTVSDRGVGFDLGQLNESRRLGLLGMRERVELLNGEFSLMSNPEHGTQIDVTIPLPDDTENGQPQ